MNRKIISICVLTLVIIPILNVSGNISNALPNTPIITGETNGIIGMKYNYTIRFFDPDNNDVFYKIRWGDCMIINNAGPYSSGEEVIFSHAFCELCCGPGDFTIQVKAFDNDGGESGWGTLTVTMSQDKDKPILNQVYLTFFELLIKLFNDLL
jgi:hypothetical protein